MWLITAADAGPLIEVARSSGSTPPLHHLNSCQLNEFYRAQTPKSKLLGFNTLQTHTQASLYAQISGGVVVLTVGGVVYDHSLGST